jgi:hypothetical protein
MLTRSICIVCATALSVGCQAPPTLEAPTDETRADSIGNKTLSLSDELFAGWAWDDVDTSRHEPHDAVGTLTVDKVTTKSISITPEAASTEILNSGDFLPDRRFPAFQVFPGDEVHRAVSLGISQSLAQAATTNMMLALYVRPMDAQGAPAALVSSYQRVSCGDRAYFSGVAVDLDAGTLIADGWSLLGIPFTHQTYALKACGFPEATTYDLAMVPVPVDHYFQSLAGTYNYNVEVISTVAN